MNTTGDDHVVASLSRAAQALLRRDDPEDLDRVFAGIVGAAVDTVPGADGGGVTVADRSRITSRHPTGTDVHVLDDLQAQFGEGPCIDAAARGADGATIYAPDLGGVQAQQEWPVFGPAAVEKGFRSLLSTPLVIQPGQRSALNLYAYAPDAFDESATTLARLFALQAAVLLHGEDKAAHLRVALESRDVIGQAKGILQERFDVDDTDAFQMMVRSSQDTNMKLADIAEWLVRNRRRTRPGSDPGT
ncbi:MULTISPECIES: GAF and ANTAR domain-containing protein [unclassified Pseudonocardia]|uniref:GAF and ANTAR domain-containing protein n=1 Tax=unclassified Pseudonocardia TaxID=2619320 RepID=UPI0001FFE103|nr:GAF and ANTAR domain-containing protein [Pseudonocardia sp. Ae707_Ps1]OLM20220.1 hypothetical protein Ae707Ps1_4479c [Pseudonocardia sp. Ae707_Ps1]